MNGEMYQLATIVAASKKALKENKAIIFSREKYVNKITFSFLNPKFHLLSKKRIATDVNMWFEYVKQKGLKDIKMLCPYAVKERHFLGFANATNSSIVCYYRNGDVTYFVPQWEFDNDRKEWKVHYSEHEWKNPPLQKLKFQNNTDDFKSILSEISDFANEIECEYFADVFSSAINILDGGKDYPDIKYGLELPQIPDENLQMFEAASLADVFGAMGSWNDSPPCMAHDKGLDKEYESLSSKLLLNVRLAILYAINEW